MTTLTVEHLSKSFPTAGEPLVVLRDVSLQLSGGESLAIVGPSGSGKSTLLQILGTLDRPDDGTVRVDGEDPFELSEQELAHWRNRQVGFIFQDHHLLPQLSVIENVLVPALATGNATDAQIDRATELLSDVGLSDRTSHLPSELSGGERERVAIARALLMRPAMILADEPTGNLDRRTAESVTELLLRLQRETEVILICVTHSDALADAMQKRAELMDGKLVDGATV
ncbi:ABC transporter ATP-binding protein [Roseiconus nitratireducens]|uniref:ABC transporter ATP-binding protein n=1 Tax=Roseiconus nitratireducens TaxID=2605748 RepID=A0A5M6D3Y2_9BACT|nr:ABC transporter ATP-binding protein [Roseiconus nitratireducens]KAA5542218.1 ABC transporter ATP-binding protein [Roseiconus nitratireducens]